MNWTGIIKFETLWIKSLLLEEKGDRLRWMRWKRNNDCFRNLHLISHFMTASPQGEAFDENKFFCPGLDTNYNEFEFRCKLVNFLAFCEVIV